MRRLRNAKARWSAGLNARSVQEFPKRPGQPPPFVPLCAASVRALRSRSVESSSAVGAGDSFLGALVFGLAAGAAHEDCFRSAVAAGAAALLYPGTGLCRPDDVARLSRDVAIERG